MAVSPIVRQLSYLSDRDKTLLNFLFVIALVVDYLDQYQVLKNGLDNGESRNKPCQCLTLTAFVAERGTERWLNLVDETAIVSDYRA